MRDEEFQILLQGVKEAVEHYHGLRHDLRTTILPGRPEPMEPAEVRALRERTGASQAFFAHALNVSTKTVQAWESGARTPDGGNLKLLRLAEAHPEIVFEHLHEPPPGPVQQPAKPRRTRKPRPQPV
ncbi:MAG TPA: helix-turn-helix domain-containing protein [Longimicrobium sp.]|jgi:DNA-binding transcriptional regulator YiaG|uniref:helix-turn-helix domain-containing protein n=1 Tax=Longimicrobium sp. TaxID=2029185 RepID=UPI002ED9DBB2